MEIELNLGAYPLPVLVLPIAVSLAILASAQ